MERERARARYILLIMIRTCFSHSHGLGDNLRVRLTDRRSRSLLSSAGQTLSLSLSRPRTAHCQSVHRDFPLVGACANRLRVVIGFEYTHWHGGELGTGGLSLRPSYTGRPGHRGSWHSLLPLHAAHSHGPARTPGQPVVGGSCKCSLWEPRPCNQLQRAEYELT